jgi:PAS domain-containing protein
MRDDLLDQAAVAAASAANDASLVEALHLSEERFRLAVTASGLGISDHDLVTGELHWSPEMRAILGVDKDMPASLDVYLELLHPDDQTAALSRCAAITAGAIAAPAGSSANRTASCAGSTPTAIRCATTPARSCATSSC